MTQDEIISAASKLGLSSMYDASRDTYSNWGDKVLAFAKLVATKEREAVAQMVEPWLLPEYVEKIRARGQA